MNYTNIADDGDENTGTSIGVLTLANDFLERCQERLRELCGSIEDTKTTRRGHIRLILLLLNNASLFIQELLSWSMRKRENLAVRGNVRALIQLFGQQHALAAGISGFYSRVMCLNVPSSPAEPVSFATIVQRPRFELLNLTTSFNNACSKVGDSIVGLCRITTIRSWPTKIDDMFSALAEVCGSFFVE